MAARDFLDSNVLVYTDDEDEPAKRDAARALVHAAIANGTGVVSTQVLQEYFVSTTRKLHVDPARARRNVATFAQLPHIVVRPDLIFSAIDLHRLTGIHFYDALIVKCASAGGCARILTEDLPHGSKIDGVLIENPFLGLPPAPKP